MTSNFDADQFYSSLHERKQHDLGGLKSEMQKSWEAFQDVPCDANQLHHLLCKEHVELRKFADKWGRHIETVRTLNFSPDARNLAPQPLSDRRATSKWEVKGKATLVTRCASIQPMPNAAHS